MYQLCSELTNFLNKNEVCFGKSNFWKAVKVTLIFHLNEQNSYSWAGTF